jgi:hypothetical protein
LYSVVAMGGRRSVPAFKETSVSSNRTASSGSWMRYGVE